MLHPGCHSPSSGLPGNRLQTSPKECVNSGGLPEDCLAEQGGAPACSSFNHTRSVTQLSHQLNGINFNERILGRLLARCPQHSGAAIQVVAATGEH